MTIISIITTTNSTITSGGKCLDPGVKVEYHVPHPRVSSPAPIPDCPLVTLLLLTLSWI